MPAGTGVASPLIVGDRIYLPSEPHDLVAIYKADGRVRWIRRSSAFEAATSEERQRPAYKAAEAAAAKIDALNASLVAGTASAEQLQEKKAELEKDLQKKMKRVDPDKYALGVTFATRASRPPVRAADLRLVRRRRGRLLRRGRQPPLQFRMDRRKAVEHGFSSSPLLIDGKLVVFMRDLMAFEATTGKLAWQVPLGRRRRAESGGIFPCGSPAATAVGPAPVIVLGSGVLAR